MDKMNPYVRVLEAEKLMSQSKYREALPLLLKALDEKDYLSKETVVYNIAFCYLSINEYRKGASIFEQLILESGLSVDTAYNLGICYLRINELQKALMNFSYIFEQGLDPCMVYNIGINLIENGFPSQAKDIFIEYLNNYPNDLDAMFGLGIAYQKSAEYQKAIGCFERIIEWDESRYETALVSLGTCYFQLGNMEKAESFIKKAVEKAPQMPEAWPS